MPKSSDRMWPAPDDGVELWIAWANQWRSVAALNMVCVGFGERTMLSAASTPSRSLATRTGR